MTGQCGRLVSVGRLALHPYVSLSFSKSRRCRIRHHGCSDWARGRRPWRSATLFVAGSAAAGPASVDSVRIFWLVANSWGRDRRGSQGDRALGAPIIEVRSIGVAYSELLTGGPAPVRLVARRGDTPGGNTKGGWICSRVPSPPCGIHIDPDTAALSNSLGIGSSSQRDLLGQTRQHLSETQPAEPGGRIAGNMVGPIQRASWPNMPLCTSLP